MDTFDTETRGAISHEIARMMGIDGQSPHRSDKQRVEAIELNYVDENNHEVTITEFKGEEIGENTSLDEIVRMIESATMRDALTRFGIALYALYFHLVGGQKNRGRFPFTVPGQGSTYRNTAGASAPMMRYGGGGFGMMGQPQDSMTTAEQMRVLVEMLKWSTEERRVNDERTERMFKSYEGMLKNQQSLIEDFSKRELRVRELEDSMQERKYELDKKKEADAEKKEWVNRALAAAEKYGPLLLPPVVEAIRKFNHGPNYVPNESETRRKVEEVIARTQAATAEEGDGSNGAASSNGAAGHGSGASPSPGEATTPEEMATRVLDVWHQRIAFDLCRLVAMLKASGRLEAFQNALKGVGQAKTLFEAILKATAVGDPESAESIRDLAELALGFGMTLQENQLAALGLVNIAVGFERVALIQFAQLLQEYVKVVEQIASVQSAGDSAPPQGGEGNGAPAAPPS